MQDRNSKSYVSEEITPRKKVGIKLQGESLARGPKL